MDSKSSRPDLDMGDLLMGRYQLDAELFSNLPGAQRFRATDKILSRQTEVHLLTGDHTEDAVDAARSAALVDDPRIVRIIDAGRYSGISFVLTAPLDGVSLAEVGPLPAAQARAVAGEVATALAQAAAHDVHHLALRPELIFLGKGDTVRIGGMAWDAAARGRADEDPVSSAAADAKALVSILYAALTARWPGETPSVMPPPPLWEGNPVAPIELVSGVPGDLNTLCAVALATGGVGPADAAQVVEDLGIWPTVRISLPYSAFVRSPVPREAAPPAQPTGSADSDQEEPNDQGSGAEAVLPAEDPVRSSFPAGARPLRPTDADVAALATQAVIQDRLAAIEAIVAPASADAGSGTTRHWSAREFAGLAELGADLAPGMTESPDADSVGGPEADLGEDFEADPEPDLAANAGPGLQSDFRPQAEWDLEASLEDEDGFDGDEALAEEFVEEDGDEDLEEDWDFEDEPADLDEAEPEPVGLEELVWPVARATPLPALSSLAEQLDLTETPAPGPAIPKVVPRRPVEPQEFTLPPLPEDLAEVLASVPPLVHDEYTYEPVAVGDADEDATIVLDPVEEDEDWEDEPAYYDRPLNRAKLPRPGPLATPIRRDEVPPGPRDEKVRQVLEGMAAPSSPQAVDLLAGRDWASSTQPEAAPVEEPIETWSPEPVADQLLAATAGGGTASGTPQGLPAPTAPVPATPAGGERRLFDVEAPSFNNVLPAQPQAPEVTATRNWWPVITFIAVVVACVCLGLVILALVGAINLGVPLSPGVAPVVGVVT
ncbi:MAG: hypothetical protein LBC97_01950 [Bifidobacteriaceae bacterium]|jgi:hypothetical protein|nr:hypothetical protein [Bifidobacteriaceae bacterium]